MSVTESTARRLQADLARVQVAGRLPSVVACVVRDGFPVWSDGYGDVPGPVRHTQYRIGSITKTMTAVAVLALAEAGDVDLDAPASTYWPEAPYGGATLRQLLGHGGGLPAEPAGAWWERAGRPDNAAALAVAENGRRGPHPPGHTFHYSNLGYAVLGEVHARVRGTTWAEAVRTDVLDPLGMRRTTLEPAGARAHGFSVHPWTSALLPEPDSATGSMAPAGQLWSTLDDLARWVGFLLHGQADVLGADALTRARAGQVGDGAAGPGSRHGLGLQLAPGGADGLVGHSGSMPGFVASLFVDPVRRTGAVLLANGTTGLSPVADAERLLATLEACEPSLPPPWTPTSEVPTQLAPLLGVWHWGARTQVWSMAGDEMVAHEAGRLLHRFAVVQGRVTAVAGYFTGEEVVLRHGVGGAEYLDLGTFVLTRAPYAPGDVVPGGTPTV
ncbi:serine hydrolase domain-containing protein [uncultured Nocardioides sp.]|uniref:serine hydrolase domain-containing protein n=1 Tax=uncultured Nocardioides sp. TaxID=198441 RepID=UPI00261BFA19|nr:serine hydrolase domain-containing protein [uncultured Nocardioides sp.]